MATPKKNTPRPKAAASGYTPGKSQPKPKVTNALIPEPKRGTATAMSLGVNRGAGTNARNAGKARTQASNVSGAKGKGRNYSPSTKPASGYQAGAKKQTKKK